jgi:arylsulfatase A-like enzyme
MVIRFPAAFEAGGRVHEQVQTFDLFKTILDLADVQAPKKIESQSLLYPIDRPFTIAELGVPKTPYGTSLERFGLQSTDLAKYQVGLTAIRTDAHKLILGTDNSVELYAWPDDSGETYNIAASEADIVSNLAALLNTWWSGHGGGMIGKQDTDIAVSSELRARLQALGYID